MASNRDPQKDYRTNRRGRRITSSATRSKRSKKASAPKPTSSSTRSRGSGTGSRRVTSDSDRVTKKPITGGPRGAQGPRTAPQQGPSRRVTGLIGSRGPSRSKPPISPSPKAPGRFSDKPQVQNNVRALKNSPLKYLKGGGKLGALLTIGEVTKAALSGRQGEKTKMKPAPGQSKAATAKAKKDAKETNRQSKASSFDRAFAAARKAGKKTFTWNGKSYSTKMK